MNQQSGASSSKNLKCNLEDESNISTYSRDYVPVDSTEQTDTPIFTTKTCPLDEKRRHKIIENLDKQDLRIICVIGSSDNIKCALNQPKSKDFDSSKENIEERDTNDALLTNFFTYICQHEFGTNANTQLKSGGKNNDSHEDCNNSEVCGCSSTNSDGGSFQVITPSAPPPPPPYTACAVQVEENIPRYNEAPFNCCGQINLLMETQKDLKRKIDQMEGRQKAGAALLQQADRMWSDMEKGYKHKIAASITRQKIMNQQVKEIQESVSKWRRNFHDLETQKSVLLKCRLDIKEKKIQRQNDITFLETEMKDMALRKEKIHNEIKGLEVEIEPKKQNSEKEIIKLNKAIQDLEARKASALKVRNEKQRTCTDALNAARIELMNKTKVLMQIKMENRILEEKKNSLEDELIQAENSLKTCEINSEMKSQKVKQEIQAIENEIEQVMAKIGKCTKCIDTKDMQSCCADCPMCNAANNCVVKDGCCSSAGGGDNCICTDVKLRFIENVLDNMYSVLRKQFNTISGQNVAEAITRCLKNNSYGKLTKETRIMLKDFIMDSLKKYMNLTLVAGAAKTRCEMDADTYKRLMTCLNEVKVTAPVKPKEETESKKQSCKFWNDCNECNCPKGPTGCICVTKLGRSGLMSCSDDCKTKKIRSPVNTPLRNAKCGTENDNSSSNCFKYYNNNTKAAQCLIEVNHQAFQTTKSPKISSYCACPDDLQNDLADSSSWKSATGIWHLAGTKQKDCSQCCETLETTDCYANNITSSRIDKANDPLVLNVKKNDVVTYRDIVKVVVHGKDKTQVEIFADVITTSSGDMALELNESVLVTTQMNELKSAYLSLQQTPFGVYYIEISSVSTPGNTIKVTLLKTSAGTALMFIPATFINKIRGNDLVGDLSSSPSRELSKPGSTAASETELNDLIRSNLYFKHNEQLLAILRKSGSHTFDVVLDKEHEGRYSENLSLLFSPEKKLNIAFKETHSSISILNKDNENKDSNHIIRSPSGKLKLICSSKTEILDGVKTCALTYSNVPFKQYKRLLDPDDPRSLLDLAKPKIMKHSPIIAKIGLPDPFVIAPFSAKATQISLNDVALETNDLDTEDIFEIFIPDHCDKPQAPSGISQKYMPAKCLCNRIPDHHPCEHLLTTVQYNSSKRYPCPGKRKSKKHKRTIRNNPNRSVLSQEKTIVEQILPFKTDFSEIFDCF